MNHLWCIWFQEHQPPKEVEAFHSIGHCVCRIKLVPKQWTHVRTSAKHCLKPLHLSWASFIVCMMIMSHHYKPMLEKLSWSHLEHLLSASLYCGYDPCSYIVKLFHLYNYYRIQNYYQVSELRVFESHFNYWLLGHSNRHHSSIWEHNAHSHR